MKRSIVCFVVGTLAIFSGLFGACSSPVRSAQSFPSITRSAYLLGPEAFDYCGGWVEFWVEIENDGEKARLFLKVTPPVGKTWAVWKDHVRLEHPHWPNRSLKIKDVPVLDVQGVKDGQLLSNTLSWEIDFRGLNPDVGLVMDLLPFEGCEVREELRGVVLSPSD